jgi:hypothetical protein
VKIGRGFRAREAALAALKEQRKRKSRGEYVPPEHERLTVANLLDAYLEDLKDRGKKSIASVKCRIELFRNRSVSCARWTSQPRTLRHTGRNGSELGETG